MYSTVHHKEQNIYMHSALIQFLTCTDSTSILVVSAVTVSKSIVAALCEVTLFTVASHFVEPDRTSPWSKCGKQRGIHCSGVTQLSTDNKGIQSAPVVVTDSAPLIQVEDLDTPLLWTSPSHQSDGPFCF